MQRFPSTLFQRVVLSLLVGLWSVLSAAQGCPELKAEDFTVDYYAANADCHTDGQIIVTYRNNVTGFSKLTYETSTNGTSWGSSVEQTSLSAPTTIPLTGWTAGQTIHLRVTATCASGTSTVTFPTQVHRSEMPHAVKPSIETTPAGGCSATAGSIGVSVGTVTGFTKAEYRLYQGTTLLNTITSNTPYAQSNFYNLPSGTYKVVMRATPACTPASPTAAFKNGAYEVEETVKVGYFSILPSPIPTRGTCNGGVRVAVARVMGVNSIKYEILPAGGHATHAAALQTKQLTFPNFTHTFLGVALGNYEIRATTDCGTVEVVPFSVTTGAPGTLTTKVLRNTYMGCDKGIIMGSVPGTTEACPVDYTLIPKSNPSAPAIVKNGVTTESVTFDNLATGYYELQASWGGQVQKETKLIHTVSLGDLELSGTPADYACDPSGTITVKLKNGVYEESMTLTLSLDGTPVRSVTLATTDREKTITNLVPGGYDISLKSECGNEIKSKMSVLYKNMPPLGFALDPFGAFDYDECEDMPYLVLNEYIGGSTGAQTSSTAYKKFMQGATYELYVDGTLISSGAMPRPLPQGTWANQYKFPTQKTLGKIELRIYPSCGTPMFTYGGDFQPNVFGAFERPTLHVTVRKPSTSCDATGEIYVYYPSMNTTFTYTLSITNTDTGNNVFTKTYTNTSSLSEKIEKLPAGHYSYEFYSACRTNNKVSGTFEINALSGGQASYNSNSFITAFAACNGKGRIAATFYDGTSIVAGLKYKYRLVNSAGVEVAKRESATRDITFPNLAPDTYTLYVTMTSPSCSDAEVAYDPVTVPAGLPSNAFSIQGTSAKKGDFCTNNGEVKVTLTPNQQGQYYVTSGIMHLLDPVTKADAVAPITMTDLTKPVTFTGVKPGQYTAVFETSCGNAQSSYTINVESNSIPQNFVKTQVVNIFPGCQKGKIKVVADPSNLGLPNLPIKIELIKNEAERQPTVVDSIKSSSTITEHTFDNVPEGNYEIRYTYCGMQFTTNVGVSQVTKITLQAYATTPGPCETGTINVSSSPADASIELELKVKNKLTGIVEQTLTANGGATTAITNLTPGQNYEVSADIKGSCVQTTSKADVAIPNATIQVSRNYSWRLDCFNNGWIEMWLNPGTTGRITKVQYTIQPSGGGTPTVAQTTDPTEHKKFLGLAPGKYKIQAIATCQFANGTISQYTWNNGGNELELTAGYTTMTAYQNDTKMRATMACPARGAIGLTIQNGNSNNRRVFIQQDPSGTVSPEREIFPISQRPSDNENSWGGDLAPGHYRIRINDGCMDIIRDITVPLVGDLVTYKSVGCVSTSNTCKMSTSVTFDLSAYPNNYLRCDLANSYEVAIVPRGGDRTTEPWSSAWYSGSSSSTIICDYATVTDSFTTIPYGNTADVLLRLKGCPSTVRRYPITLTPCCQFRIGYQNIDCDRNQLYVYQADVCSQWDVAVCKYNSGTYTELRRKRMRFNGLVNQQYFDNDWIVPTDDYYYLRIYPAGSSAVLCDGYSYPISKKVYLNYVVEPMSTSCSWERYTWRAYSQCPVRVKFKIWDVSVTPNQLVDESPGLMSDYKSNYHYVRNHTYHIRLYDAANNLVNFYPINSSTPVSVWQHVASYETPVNYKQPDITLYNSCSNQYTTWSLPTRNDRNCEGFPAVYAAGVAQDRGRLPIINKIEVRHNGNGDVYYTDDPVWNQIWRMDNYYCRENRVMGKSWKVRRANGTVADAYALPVGNYTLTVYEDCGPKVSTFNIGYLPPAVINLNYTATMDCQGKFTIKPTGSAYFPGRSETMTITGFRRSSSDDPAGTRYTWGQSYDSYSPIQNLTVYLKPQNSSECQVNLSFDLSRYYLSFDASSSASYFCLGSNTGDISIGLQGGNPPYTYKLLKPDGTLVDQKTSSGGVNFKTGKLGEIYRIDATDACGLTHIYQDVLLQDPKEIGYTMDRDYYFCEGDPSSFEAINLAGATYEWTGPNGFTSNNRQVNITATTATAGTYHLKVKPATCSTTINATVKVNVVKVKEVGTSVEKRLCSGQTANINIGPATALSNGVPATNHKYQWQLTEDPTDPNSWSGIVGATSEQLNYTPPFQGTYYVRRVTVLGNCSDYSAVSKIVADPGLNSIVSNDELNVTIDHKNPFTLTAGFVTGNPNRTYQWQRSLNKTTWTNITPNGTNQTYTETQRYGSIVYYKRITSAGTCSTESPIITVRFKKRYPAMVNPHLRQRVLTE